MNVHMQTIRMLYMCLQRGPRAEAAVPAGALQGDGRTERTDARVGDPFPANGVREVVREYDRSYHITLHRIVIVELTCFTSITLYYRLLRIAYGPQSQARTSVVSGERAPQGDGGESERERDKERARDR